MFEIEYKGGNTVIINTKKAKVIVDPKLSVVGLKDISTKDAIEIATEPRFATNNSDARLVICGPGDYGVADLDIHGIAARRHIDTDGMIATIYRIEAGDIRLGVIGNINYQLSDEQLEELGVLDILVLPIGGNGYTLDAVNAATLTRHISPKIVIPVHYKDSQVHYEVPQDDIGAFTKELGVPVETVSKYKYKANSAVGEQLTVIELTRS